MLKRSKTKSRKNCGESVWALTFFILVATIIDDLGRRSGMKICVSKNGFL